MNILRYRLITVVCATFFLAATPAYAAQIHIVGEAAKIARGDQFMVTVFIDTEGETLNAFEGSVLFPETMLDLKEIRDGGSLINFWVERPSSTAPGEIKFSGITPGGYRGRGVLFSLVFEAQRGGNVAIAIRNARVFRHDGQGTETRVSAVPFAFRISQEAGYRPRRIAKTPDPYPPESFVLEIARDPTLFDGKWFVVFTTQDKGLGIDHYEIQERRVADAASDQWRVTQSPAVLMDQRLRSFIFVKAVDRRGNVRVAELSPRYPQRWYDNYENWIIIIIGVIAAYGIGKKVWRKRRGQ